MSSIPSPLRERKPSSNRPRLHKPATLSGFACLSRPVCPCEMCPAGIPGAVSINGTTYAVAFNATLPRSGEPEVRGWRLLKGDGTTYDLCEGEPESFQCDCPDYVFRRAYQDSDGCKHCLACVELRALGVI